MRTWVIAVGQLLACSSPRPGEVRAAAPDVALDVPPLAADGGAPPRAPGDGAVFGHPVAVVGATSSTAVSAVSRSPDPNGGPPQLSTYESDYTVEVLAVDGPAASRVRLRFDRNVHRYQENELATVIHGHEYIVDARAPFVRDANDTPVSEKEAERVLDVFPDLGTRGRVDEVLPDEPMRIGERRDELAGAILRVIHPRAWTLREGTASLARVASGHAVFTVKLDASSAAGLRLVVAGEAHVRLRDSRLSELALDGTYSEPPGMMTTPEPGTFKLRRTTRDTR